MSPAISTLFNKLLQIARKIRLAKLLTALLITSIFVSTIFTYIAITNPDKFEFIAEPANQSNLVLLNVFLLLMLATLVSRKLIYLWKAREKGRAGSKLLMKMVIMFSLVAIVPSIIVGVSSSFYLNLGIKSWFDERVSNAVVGAVKVADAYQKEHEKVISINAINLANKISINRLSYEFSKVEMEKLLNSESAENFLAEAVTFRRDQSVVVSSRFSGIFNSLSDLRSQDFEEMDKGGVVVLSGDDKEKVSAVVKISGIDNLYLLITRYIDPEVKDQINQAENASKEYLVLKRQIVDFQTRSTWFFVMIAIFLLLGALWMAFRFANNLVAPVTSLVAATDRVKRGEFTVRVKESSQDDEIGTLTRSFNEMAEELETQKRDLMLAKREAEEKSTFMEAVLTDLSSGVIAVDGDKKLVLINRASREIFALNDKVMGRFLRDVVPEFLEALDEAIDKKSVSFQKQVALRRKAKRMTFILRISPQTAKNLDGYILTFDDVSELVSAQRSAAWSDVARKIAHEIKNPLTPINLSAQRLAKKFSKIVPEEEKENFDGYTNTIIRHTADIANIITEFSNFAKLPAPKFVKTDISILLKDAIFSGRVANSKITMELDMPDRMETNVDPSQIMQVLTNVIKNAAESVSESRSEGGGIKAIAKMTNNIEITIDDNGKGFPEELIDRLTEPYVTTRSKGTGLGLAIVKKIMEDHNGKIELSNIRGGARVKLILPIL